MIPLSWSYREDQTTEAYERTVRIMKCCIHARHYFCICLCDRSWGTKFNGALSHKIVSAKIMEAGCITPFIFSYSHIVISFFFLPPSLSLPLSTLLFPSFFSSRIIIEYYYVPGPIYYILQIIKSAFPLRYLIV